MEIKLWKLRKISQRLCEEVAAPKGAEAHISGTAGVRQRHCGAVVLLWTALLIRLHTAFISFAYAPQTFRTEHTSGHLQ
jgi:hypothetical protein